MARLNKYGAIGGRKIGSATMKVLQYVASHHRVPVKSLFIEHADGTEAARYLLRTRTFWILHSLFSLDIKRIAILFDMPSRDVELGIEYHGQAMFENIGWREETQRATALLREEFLE